MDIFDYRNCIPFPWINRKSIETEEGQIDIEIKDSDGNIIFSEDAVQTKEFEVNVSGKITIRLDGEEHKGKFVIE